MPVVFTSTEHGRNEWIPTKKFITKVGQPPYSPDLPALWCLDVCRIEKWPESTEWNVTKLLKGIWENGFKECFQQITSFHELISKVRILKDTPTPTRAFGWDSKGMVNMQTFYFDMFLWIDFSKKKCYFKRTKPT